MASIADVISVSVTVQDSVPSEDGFGILACFASVGGAWTGWQTFSNDSDGLASLVLAGAAVGSAAYKMLQAAASQNPKVSKVKIFSRTTHASQTFKLSPTVLTEGYVYSLKISNGSTTATVTHTNGASETAITIATALAAAVTSAAVGTIVGTHSGSDVFFTISVSSGTVRFYLKDVSLGITVEDTSSDGGIATDLAAAVALDNDWFGLAIDTTSATEIAAAATFAEANSKVFLALSEDSAIATSSTTDIASSAKTSGYNFTSVFYET
ncbi:MAG TPA: hypothetical protein VN903_10995, partial [Polyangia bacterium]|nr:hypothetical protein [Polyangia bacterium]